MLNLFIALFVCAVFGSVQSVPMSAELRNMETWSCLNSQNLTAETVDFLSEYHKANCNNGPQTSVVCKFALKTIQSFKIPAEKNVSTHPQKTAIPSSFSSIPDDNQTLSEVHLYVYNLFEIHPFIKLLRCLEPDFNLDALYFTSISFGGKEYYYGPDGISTVPDGESSFGKIRERHILAALPRVEYLNLPVKTIRERIETWAKNEFAPEEYNLFTNNCNSFTNKLTNDLLYSQIVSFFQKSVTELAKSPLGGWVMRYQDKLKFTLN